jgi:choline kinase
MHAVILAAGEGSRMGPHTDDVPKPFMDLGGRTLYDRQRAVLDAFTDTVTVVLGYAAENVVDEVGDANVVVVEDWAECDNAESLRRALTHLDDDVLVCNGDVLVTARVVERLRERHAAADDRNVVACIRGHQEGSTAIRVDEDGLVTDYGMIRGHRHAGMGIVDRRAVDAAERFLRDRRGEWYPVVYPAFDTEMVPIPASQHVEINRPRDRVAAKQKLPLDTTGEANAGT